MFSIGIGMRNDWSICQTMIAEAPCTNNKSQTKVTPIVPCLHDEPSPSVMSWLPHWCRKTITVWTQNALVKLRQYFKNMTGSKTTTDSKTCENFLWNDILLWKELKYLMHYKAHVQTIIDEQSAYVIWFLNKNWKLTQLLEVIELNWRKMAKKNETTGVIF
jgi:hypothetical protein